MFSLALISTLALAPVTDANAAAAHSAQTVFPAITLSADFSEDAALTMIQTHLSTFKFVSFAKDATCENWLKKPRNFTEKTFTYACQNAFSNSGKTPITLDAISFIRQFVASCTHKPADLETSLLWCHEMLSIIRAVDSGQDSTFEKKITLLLRMERILPLSESAREDTPQLFHNLLTHIIDNESAYNRFVLWANRLLPRQTDKSFSKESYDYLANGIRSGVISTSEALEPLDESNRYLESARLYRIAIQEKSGVACRGLCGLINEGLISRDENNQHIFEDQIPLVIIRLLEKAVSLGDYGAHSNLAQAKLFYCTGPSEASDLNRLRSDALNGKSSALHTFSGLISLKKNQF